MLMTVASSASGAVTIGAKLVNGSAIVGSPSGSACAMSPLAYAFKTLDASRQAPGGLAAPSYGVITRWRVTWIQGDSTVQGVPLALRTYTYNGGESFTAGGSTGAQIVPVPASNPGVVEMPGTRLPIDAGQLIGVDKLDAGGANKCLVRDISPGLCSSEEFASPLGPGAMGTGLARPGTCLLEQADVEPDADHDGFGDETQDECPSNAATQAACPAAAVTPTPTRHRKCKKRRHKRAAIAKKKCRRHKHHGRRD
jgi:hypothetical protein